jgi:3-oxoacyl-[acyl-carrier-protein] synthase III
MMDYPVLRHCSRILSTGSYYPRRIVENSEISRILDSSDEWIIQRSGIRTRRFAGPDETIQFMAAAAAGKAIAQAGLSADQIDAIIVATMSYLFQAPPLATLVASILEVKSAAAFDVSAACSGFCHALSVANGMVTAGLAANVVVIGAERMSDIIDSADRSTAFIFGDGAGAVVVGRSEQPGIGPVVWGSEPTQHRAIEQDFSWISREGEESGRPYLRMQGPQVFRWVITNVPEVARRALALSGVTVRDLVAVIPHQANLRISNAIATALDLPAHVRVARDVVDTGNTSAASIPLAMDRMISCGEIGGGGLSLLIGFGAGLGYAAQVVELPV